MKGGGMMEELMMAMKGGGWGKGKSVKGKFDKGKGGKKGPAPARKIENVEVVSEGLIGSIKSFSHASGYGFIENDQVKAEYGGDVFLSHAQLGEFKAGDQVAFDLFLNQQGKPQAKDLRAADGAGGAAGWEAAAT